MLTIKQVVYLFLHQSLSYYFSFPNPSFLLFSQILGLGLCKSQFCFASWFYIGSGNMVALEGIRTSLVTQTVKNLPAMQETQVLSLGQEDPLEKRTATPSSIRAWRSPWTEELSGLQSVGWQRVGQD